MRDGAMGRRLWRWFDRVMDAIIWGYDMLMMYVAALFLIPLCVIASLKVVGVGTVWTALDDIGLENAWLRLLLLGAPVWLAVTLYARFSSRPGARAFSDRLDRWKWAVIWTSCAAMGGFAVLALIFAT
jgi:hypothetical protein